MMQRERPEKSESIQGFCASDCATPEQFFMEQTTEPSLIRKLARVFGWLAAWAWTVAGGQLAVSGSSSTARATPAHKRLVRALLRHLSVSIDSVAGKKKRGHHPVRLDSFCHCLCYYHARPPGLEDRGARHIPDRPVTMLERKSCF